ncbi:hypothetical protein INS49_002538 [Diaporthe citri]|uniref:uncharacterized protein n=1 Tax=Diaporthe citri TaxID=83186 RepID=UPI001C810C88|nr:uncharacterized protein INS49_002538 [Diaporthe citri]KAG6368333.1 hypothetical protein INS49_002538 [Diaporthe citri]
MFLDGRFRRDGYGLSLIGHAMYQLWSPDSLSQEDIDSLKDASRDVDNTYRVFSFGDSKRNQS